jgi:diguanylate cyclase (GGDEF)-like protein
MLRDIEEVGIGAFWATDVEGRMTYLSEKARLSLGTSGEAVIGKPIASVFKEASVEDDVQSNRSLAFKLRAKSRVENHVVEVTTCNAPAVDEGTDGDEAPADTDAADEAADRVYWRISGRPLYDAAGQFQGYRGDAIDITTEFLRQRRLSRQSQFDELTGLANRRRLNQQLAAMLSAFKAVGRCCALMMLDLDRFKQVNDTMGHPAGDELLKQVADRIRTIIKDRGVVGRLGGDEFQILLPDIDDRGALGDLAGRLIQLISQPYSIAGRRAVIGTSIGLAIAPYDGVETAELNSAVDMALYAAKAEGRGIFRFFTTELKEQASQGAKIEDDLHEALVTGQLQLHYQPLIDPTENRVKGAEALMRWIHPQGGTIGPERFIPIAEQSDLIVHMGGWALRQACVDAAAWPGNLRVAVNISARQFMKSDFVKVVANALASSGLAPSRLELEITESVFVGDVEEVDKIFIALKRLGVRLALDDFGTGYSSLGYLKRAPFNKIKIDQSFVRGCTQNGDTNPAIISAIVALAKALDMETVAEGVEAMDELALVRERGADLVQGFIYSPALTHEQMMGRITEGELFFKPEGPARHRADRISLYRKIGLIHEDHYYDVMLRNLSRTGARIEGLGGVPKGTEVVLDLGSGQLVVAEVVNASENAQGLRFETPLIADGAGGLITRHRISPYALAQAGMPLMALGSGTRAASLLPLEGARPPAFVQLMMAA